MDEIDPRIQEILDKFDFEKVWQYRLDNQVFALNHKGREILLSVEHLKTVAQMAMEDALASESGWQEIHGFVARAQDVVAGGIGRKVLHLYYSIEYRGSYAETWKMWAKEKMGE